MSTRAERVAERPTVIWDNDPAVRSLQEQSRAIYEDTGRWDTPEQLELNKQANLIRQGNNPMSNTVINPRTGPTTQAEADAIYPRSTTPTANAIEGGLDKIVSNTGDYGGYLKIGLLMLGGLVVISFFRGR